MPGLEIVTHNFDDKLRQHIKKQRHCSANKGLSCQAYGFSSGHVWMWELDYKENWALKNWCFWTMVLKKTLESPLHCKEIQPVHPKGDQSWGSLEGLMMKLKLQYFGHFMWRTDSFEKTLKLGKLKMGEEDDRWWDGLLASLTWWTWVWTSSKSWWWTRKPGMLQFMGLQKVGLYWVTGLNWILMNFPNTKNGMLIPSVVCLKNRDFTKGIELLGSISFTKTPSDVASSLHLIDILPLRKKGLSGLKVAIYIYSLNCMVIMYCILSFLGCPLCAKTRFYSRPWEYKTK